MLEVLLLLTLVGDSSTLEFGEPQHIFGSGGSLLSSTIPIEGYVTDNAGRIHVIDQDDAKIRGDSFVIRTDQSVSFLSPVGSSDQWKLRTYAVELGKLFQSVDYLQSPPIQVIEEEPPTQEIIEQTESIIDDTTPVLSDDKEIILTVRNPLNAFLESDYTFTARVYDKELNPRGNFDNRGGGILTDATTITGKLVKPDGSTLAIIDGEINKHGYFQTSKFIPFTAPLHGSYTLVLTAITTFDDDNTYATSSVTKTFYMQPEPHKDSTSAKIFVNAGEDQQNVKTGQKVTLAGSGSTNKGKITFLWTELTPSGVTPSGVTPSGVTPSGVTLSDPTIANPTFEAPDSAQKITFQLTVSNGIISASDTVVIIVVSSP